MLKAAQFDVIVVGARCAGAPLAADLAARGMKVCLVERARFPSEVPSTHLLHPGGVARLARLGLMDKLLATGAPPLDHGSFVIDSVRLSAEPDVMSRFEAPWLCIRRVTLDALLIEAAEQAGAQVCKKTTVQGLVHEDGAVRGVQTTNGVLRAPLVVGADGAHSTVAQLVRSREYHVSAPGRLFMWGYFEGAQWPAGYATLGRTGDIGFLGMPTDAGLHMAGIAVSISQKETCLGHTDTTFENGIQRIDQLAEYFASASRVGPLRVMTRWHGFFREATGPGWVLVGDAGHFKDPTPAQGIADALRQGEKLANAVEAGLGGDGLEGHLRNWWRWRDEDAWEMYWFATDMGAGGENPGIVADMMLDLGNEDDGTERFLRVLNHELLPSEVFNPSRLARTLARASMRHPRRVLGLVGESRSLAADELKRRRLRKRPQFETAGGPRSGKQPGEVRQLMNITPRTAAKAVRSAEICGR